MAPQTGKPKMKLPMKRSAKQHPVVETAPKENNDDEAVTTNADIADVSGVAAPEVDAEA